MPAACFPKHPLQLRVQIPAVCWVCSEPREMQRGGGSPLELLFPLLFPSPLHPTKTQTPPGFAAQLLALLEARQVPGGSGETRGGSARSRAGGGNAPPGSGGPEDARLPNLRGPAPAVLSLTLPVG